MGLMTKIPLLFLRITNKPNPQWLTRFLFFSLILFPDDLELVPRRFRASNSILFPEDFEFVPRRLSPTCVNQVIEFVKKHVGSENPRLAGNSVYVDFLFLKVFSLSVYKAKQKYMPELAALFPHILVDVSSVKALCSRWFPIEKRRAPAKKNNHRAMDDIRESIKELKYYKKTIFKARK